MLKNVFVFAFICEAFYLSVFVFANKWDVQLFVVTVEAKFYLLQALPSPTTWLGLGVVMPAISHLWADGPL